MIYDMFAIKNYLLIYLRLGYTAYERSNVGRQASSKGGSFLLVDSPPGSFSPRSFAPWLIRLRTLDDSLPPLSNILI